MPRPTRSFFRRVLLSQLAVIVVTLALVTGVFAWMGARSVTEVTETKALATARTLAIDPEVRKGATQASAEPAGEADDAITSALLEITGNLRSSSGIEFAVITDDRGIRLTHPNRDNIGRRVSTSPDEALAGRESVTHERGTLGETVRAKVPIYSAADDETVVGEVSVGIHASVLDADLRREFLALGSVAVFALVIGVIASLALGRRLRRETLGVGPEELAEMARDQGAVLRGLDDGVLAFSSSGVPTLSNSTAEQLLGIAHVDTGRDTTVSVPEDTSTSSRADVPEVIRSMMLQAPDHGALRRRVNVGDRILLATAVRVSRDGVSVGGVVTLRDETQVLTMARQLESVTSMARALRTQRHEFANRLHTVLGLVDTGATEEARNYLATILRTGPIATPVEGIEVITDPYLSALLEAKGTTAAEVGVALAVTADSLVLGRVKEPEDVTLILGNLIDNAVRAVVTNASGSGAESAPRTDEVFGRVEVTLLGSGPELHAVVTDSGGGVEDEDAQSIFDEGISSADGLDPEHGHGIGLALCRRTARRHGGRVWLLAGHDPQLGGAGFAMRLPDVLSDDADDKER
ncbi:sensor histidine kinase [Brevibacterium antiquum]|uniref:histidine kinase n=1 Tax=Brevibacterium antiquum TaxID=234835 RepID=A0A2H1IBY2_9MICO|nr:sensor histidine kinase [Brevibacterium antiquum]SMX72614.1 two-component system, CitB family, sensor kinase [Brevibacterium antiquum]